MNATTRETFDKRNMLKRPLLLEFLIGSALDFAEL